MAHPILVTGAAGRVGAVGRTVTELVLKQGKAVRAMVRTDDGRAQALRALGAEVVVGPQAARSCRLPTERRRSNSRGSLRIVSGLAANPDSIFCDGLQGPETAKRCPVLRTAGTTAERHKCELRMLASAVVRAPPKRASGELCSPLTNTYMDVGYTETNP